VFIGRFQPFHRGHKAVMDHAAGFADSALVLVGSPFRPRSPRNPLRYVERAGLIAAQLGDTTLPTAITPLVDTLHDDAAWAANVHTAVDWHLRDSGHDPATVDVVLTGYEKDKSSAYVRWFPEWGWNGAPPLTHEGSTVSATGLRMALYGLAPVDPEALAARYGEASVALLQGWAETNEPALEALRLEAAVAAQARARQEALAEAWGHPVPLSTVDAAVVCAGHVLLVRRGRTPGLGLLALPGGYLDKDETAEQAILRELREETALDLGGHGPEERRVFDHPERAERGWIRTEVFVYRLEGPLPGVQAGDDAAEAIWHPLDTVTSDSLFEDHFDILEALLPEVPGPYAAMLTARKG
jgi:bifunctional NMN adenylyltransferase/nudix hydrolase